MPGWMKHKLESRLPGEISTTSDVINNTDDITLMAESEELKSLLVKVKEESEKAGLKLTIRQAKIMASNPIMANSWGKNGNSDSDFFFPWTPNYCRW